MNIRRSLLVKMVLSFVSIMLSAVVIISAFTYYGNVEILKKHAFENNDMELSIISEKIDSYLEMLDLVSAFTYESELQELLSRVEEESAITSMRRLRGFQQFYYKRLVSLNFEGEISDIYFIYPDGEVLHQGEGIYDPSYDFTQQEWYEETVRNSERTNIVNTHRQEYNLSGRYHTQGVYNGNYYISAAKRINKLNGMEMMGVLFMDINIKKLEEMLDPLYIGNDSEVWFADENGLCVYSQDREELGMKLPFSIDQYRTDSGEDSGNFTIVVNDVEKLVSYKRSSKTGWYLVSAKPTQVVISDISLLRRNIFLVSAAAFILAVLLAVSFARRFFRPVRALAGAMKEVQEGKLDIRVDVYSEDEIGYLTNTFNHMVIRIKKLIEDNYLIRLREKDAQIEALQLQINPHFLYNTLESMSCIAYVHEVEEISIMSRALADMFRYSIRRSGSFVTVEEELNHIRNYMKIQKVRFGKKVTVDYQVEERILHCRIIPLILQPLVENSIKYGVEVKMVPVDIVIHVAYDEEQIAFIIEDNGSGIREEKRKELLRVMRAGAEMDVLEKHAHIGIVNVNSRLVYQYGEASGLHIESQEGCFTKISFHIPCSKESAPKD